MSHVRTLPPKPLLDRAGTTAGEIAETAGVSRRTVERWKAGAGIRIAAVEQCCDRLGMHPAEVYGLDYYRATGDLEAAV